MRFGELRKRIPNITERMLALQLRKLEQNKLVQRKVYAEVPLRVEYELTPSGQQLSPILIQLGEWGVNHKKTMRPAHAAADDDQFCTRQVCEQSF